MFHIEWCSLYLKGTGCQAFSMICCAPVVISNNQYSAGDLNSLILLVCKKQLKLKINKTKKETNKLRQIKNTYFQFHYMLTFSLHISVIYFIINFFVFMYAC